MHLHRRMIFLFFLVFTVSIVSAAEILQDTVCNVESDEVIEGNLFVLCRDFRMHGEVQGHIIGAAVNAVIDGDVEKNVYFLSGDLLLNGTVDGDVHYLGGVLNVQAEAELEQSDIISVALSTSLHESAQIESIIGVNYQLLIEGDVLGPVDFWGGALRIAGNVVGDVTASVGNAESIGAATQLETFLIPFPFSADLIEMGLYVPEAAQVQGDIDYTGYVPSEISGDVRGEVRFTKVETGPTFEDLAEQETRGTALESYFQQVLREIITLGLIGVVILLLIPESVQFPISVLRRRVVSSFGVGLLTFMLSFPILLLALFLSILIIFLLSLIQIDAVLFASGILIGLVDIGGASIFYFIAIYISRIVTSIALGRFLLYRFENLEYRAQWFYSLIVGTVVMALLTALPVLGWIINAIALLAGLGALMLVLQAQVRRFRDDMSRSYPVEAASNTSVVFSSPSSAVPPPKLDDMQKRPRGMDNLPEGFTWWTDDD